MRLRTFGESKFPFKHLQRLSSIFIFGINAISQTLVGGWIASQDLKAFSFFAIITGLGNLLAFLDFGAGMIVQTNYIGYLKNADTKSLTFVKFALRQSNLMSLLICLSGLALIVIGKTPFLDVLAIYLVILGLTVSTNMAINLLYSTGKSEIALLLSRSSWFWTLLLILTFKNYFNKNLYQVSLIAVTFQFLCGMIAVIFCKIHKVLKPSTNFKNIVPAQRRLFNRDYRALVIASSFAVVPQMISLHADRYIINYVLGSERISSIVAYGTLFSGTVGVLNYLYYKKRPEIDYSNIESTERESLKFIKITTAVSIFYLCVGQLLIQYLYPEQVSNLHIHLLYFFSLICVGLTLGLQLRSISVAYQKIISWSIFWQSMINIILTFILAHFLGEVAGPLSTFIAYLLIQIPFLHSRNPNQ